MQEIAAYFKHGCERVSANLQSFRSPPVLCARFVRLAIGARLPLSLSFNENSAFVSSPDLSTNETA